MWKHWVGAVAVLCACCVAAVGALAQQGRPPTKDPLSNPGGLASSAALQAQKDEVEAARGKPEEVAARKQSRTKFQNLPDEEVATLVRDRGTPIKKLGGYRALNLAEDEKLDRFFGDHTARVTKGDKAVMVVSDVPMRAKNDAGDLGLVDLALDAGDKAYRPDNPLVRVSLPRQLSDGVTFSDADVVLRVDATRAKAPAERVGDTLVYPNSGHDVDAVLKPMPTGAELSWIVRSARAPEDFRFGFESEADGDDVSLKESATKFGIDVVRDDKVVATVMPPIAVDNDGYPVPVEMDIEGEEIVVTARHQNADLKYPLRVDPGITDKRIWHDAYHPVNNPGSDNPFGWNWFTNSSNFSTFFVTYGTPGAPWGSGFHVGANSGVTHPAGSYGEWAFWAPHDAYIYRAMLTYLGHAPNDTSYLAGLYDIRNGQWNAGSYFRIDGGTVEGSGPMQRSQPFDGNQVELCAAQSCSDSAGAAGNSVVWGLVVNSTHSMPNGAAAYLGGSEISMYDRENPTAQFLSGFPGGWIDEQELELNTRVSDNGLGPYAASLSYPTRGLDHDDEAQDVPLAGGTAVTYNNAADGEACFGVICPTFFDNVLVTDVQTEEVPDTADMPTGANTATLMAYDWGGRVSSQPVQLKIDHRDPNVTFNGPLADAPDASDPNADPFPLEDGSTYSLTDIVASDGGAPGPTQSGVQNLQITLADANGANPVTLYGNANACGDNCSKAGVGSFTAAQVLPGKRRLKISATDGAQHTTTDERLVFVAGGKLLAPVSGDQFASLVPLQAQTSRSGTTGVKFQYRTTGDWTDIPAGNVKRNGTTVGSWPVPLSSGLSDVLSWDARATGLPDGPLRVKAVFTGSSTAGESGAADIKLDASYLGERYATAEIGPGTLTLASGNFSMEHNDVSIDALASDLTVSRTYNSRPATAAPGPLGPGWTLGTPVTTVGATYTVLDVFGSGTVNVIKQDGTNVMFQPAGTDYTSPDGYKDLRLSKAGSGSSAYYLLTDDEGTEVRFERAGTSTRYTPVSVTQAAGQATKTQFVYETVNGVSRVKRIIAPRPSGLSDACTDATVKAGCRVLDFDYASSTSSGLSDTQWGDYEGRLRSITFQAAAPDAALGAAASSTEVARYEYDNLGRLRSQWDPRITPALKDRYDYAAVGMSAYTPPGERPWSFTYVNATSGQLRQVSRDSLQLLTTAQWTVAYNVPVSGAGAPYNLSETEVARWGQTDVPTDATAIFPPTQVPWSFPPSSYSNATIHYLDANKLEVNTARPEGQIETTEYDHHRNVVRELTATNRDRALANGANSVDLSRRYDTQRVYNIPGTQLSHEFGPEHSMQVGSNIVNGRTHAAYVYDSGAPGGQTYNLATSKTVSARVGNADADSRTTTYAYDGQNNLGWTLRQPTSVSIDPGGLSITTRTQYDPATGQVSQTRMPSDASGTTAGTTNVAFYTVGANPSADCANKPGVAGLPCQEAPAAQPTGSSQPPIPTIGHTYNRLFQETTTFDSSASLFRYHAQTFDAAGRVTGEGVASSSGTALPDVTVGYSSTTGRQTTTTFAGGSITRDYDALGRLATYTDVTGKQTTYAYDTSNRVTNVNDGKGTHTVNAYDLNDHPTSIGDSALPFLSAPITATYDADGELLTQTLPNGLKATYVYDQAGDATNLTYQKTTNCVSNCTWLTFAAVRNAHGQITQYAGTGPTGTQYYGYDAAGRLTNVFDVQAGQCTGRVYTYDANSNRTAERTVPPLGGGVCDFAFTGTDVLHNYDQADRLIGTGIDYDAMGNTTALPAASAGGSSLSAGYFADNRAASLTQAGTTYTYALDPMRRVLARGTTGSKTMHYGDDTDNPMWTGENVGESQFTRPLAGADGNLVAIYASATGTLTYHLADLHGDIAATAGSDSSITGLASQFDADEFGVPRTPAPRYGWLGAEERTSEFTTGTIMMGQRVYQPHLGRFLQTDPIEGGAANDYDYALQDPVNVYDLDGRSAGVAWKCIKSPRKCYNAAKAALQRALNAAKKAGAAIKAALKAAEKATRKARRRVYCLVQVKAALCNSATGQDKPKAPTKYHGPPPPAKVQPSQSHKRRKPPPRGQR